MIWGTWPTWWTLLRAVTADFLDHASENLIEDEERKAIRRLSRLVGTANQQLEGSEEMKPLERVHNQIERMIEALAKLDEKSHTRSRPAPSSSLRPCQRPVRLPQLGSRNGSRGSSRRSNQPLDLEPPNGIEPLTFSLPWRRSAD